MTHLTFLADSEAEVKAYSEKTHGERRVIAQVTSSSSCSNTYWTRLWRSAVGGQHVKHSPLPSILQGAEQTMLCGDVLQSIPSNRSLSFPIFSYIENLTQVLWKKTLVCGSTFYYNFQRMQLKPATTWVPHGPRSKTTSLSIPSQLQPPGSLPSGDWRSCGWIVQPSWTPSSSRNIL